MAALCPAASPLAALCYGVKTSGKGAAMFDGRWRLAVDKRTAPVAKILKGVGLSANVLTVTGVIMAVVAAVVIGTGHFGWAVLPLAACGVPDLLDGPLAKATGSTSTRGAFLDSVADRVTDAILLGGVAWYLAGTHHPHEAVLPLAVLGVAFAVSYQRAKAESLGLSARGGLMERAERMILLGVAFLSPLLLVPVLWLLLVLTGATAVHRFARVWRQSSLPAPPGATNAAVFGDAGKGDQAEALRVQRFRRAASVARRDLLRSGRQAKDSSNRDRVRPVGPGEPWWSQWRGVDAPAARWRARRQAVGSATTRRWARDQARARRSSGRWHAHGDSSGTASDS